MITAATFASADTLHGYCVAPAAACTDNGTITPTNDNPPHFAFNYDGNVNNGHGDFWLIQLVPDNHNAGFSLTLNGANTVLSSVAASLFSSTEWNSPTEVEWLYVADMEFRRSLPSIDSFLPSTQGVDPGANGYYVYLYDFGAFDYKTAAGDPKFSVNSGSVPQGSIFLSVLTDAGTKNVTVDTPNSAAILEAARPRPFLSPRHFSWWALASWASPPSCAAEEEHNPNTK